MYFFYRVIQGGQLKTFVSTEILQYCQVNKYTANESHWLEWKQLGFYRILLWILRSFRPYLSPAKGLTQPNRRFQKKTCISSFFWNVVHNN